MGRNASRDRGQMEKKKDQVTSGKKKCGTEGGGRRELPIPLENGHDRSAQLGRATGGITRKVVLSHKKVIPKDDKREKSKI